MIDTSVFDNKTVAFYTLGCKLNFSETSAIGASLLEQGFRKAVTHEPVLTKNVGKPLTKQ